jgi:hypothetical protein
MESITRPAPPWVTPVLTTITEVMGRTFVAGWPHRLTPVHCPAGCGATCAVWSSLNRCLYPPGGSLPLASRREQVVIRCPQCGARRSTSGRTVGRNLHNGRPPLA